jgi:hypothetical protein
MGESEGDKVRIWTDVPLHFILLCEYLTRISLSCMYKGNEKMDIRKMMT